MPRRVTDDLWWEHLERDPETGVETWVRVRPLSPGDIAMRDYVRSQGQDWP